MIDAESYRFLQGIVIFVGGMLSTTAGVAWGMQRWKSKIENDIDNVSGKVLKLEKDFSGIGPHCILQKQEIMNDMRNEVSGIIKDALKDARITDIEEHSKITTTLALLVQKQEIILERLDTRDGAGGYYDRSKRARASDNVNPVTGKVL